jgi:hypothetical protein
VYKPSKNGKMEIKIRVRESRWKPRKNNMMPDLSESVYETYYLHMEEGEEKDVQKT